MVTKRRTILVLIKMKQHHKKKSNDRSGGISDALQLIVVR